jgi:sigma-B regulation protein RsbU (phosphoserine phosphatase)
MNDQAVRVLLIEDSPTDAMLVRATLGAVTGEGFAVTTADRLDNAILVANTGDFDVILLDLGLPDAQGLETFARVHEGAPQIPIIVLSGLGDDDVAMQAVRQGGQDYLPKGHAMDDLLPRAIHYAIERHRAKVEREHHAAELQMKNKVLEEDLQMAREIQQALVPQQYPEFFVTGKIALRFAHCYQSAAALSGDFFSVMRLSDHQAGVLICDVMGHGVRAALIGALTRGLMDQFIPIASQPGEFLGALNRRLSETLKQAKIDAFATAFYLVVDLAKREALFANAGHPSALILRRDAGTVGWLNVPGHGNLPLGLRGTAAYPTLHSPLDAHDAILLFTGGLYEAENAAGEAFGRERLREAVRQRLQTPCDLLLGELLHQSRQFSQHHESEDDICLVGIDVMHLAAEGRVTLPGGFQAEQSSSPLVSVV